MYRVELASGLTFYEGERRGRFPFGNVLVITGRDCRVLVDSGPGEAVIAAVREPGPVDVVINTHYHIDHMRANGSFSRAEFWCPAGEREPFESIAGFGWFTGYDIFGPDSLVDLQSRYAWRPTPVARELVHGDRLDFGGLRVEVVQLPGHTPGHIGLWFAELGVMFSADIDLSTFGPWYGDRFSDIDAYLGSLDRLAGMVTPETTVVTSHRRPMPADVFHQRLAPFKARFAERDQGILALLEGPEPVRLDHLAAQGPIYGPQPRWEPGLYKAELFMIRHHLMRLARLGVVERVDPAPPPAPHDTPGGNETWRVR